MPDPYVNNTCLENALWIVGARSGPGPPDGTPVKPGPVVGAKNLLPLQWETPK